MFLVSAVLLWQSLPPCNPQIVNIPFCTGDEATGITECWVDHYVENGLIIVESPQDWLTATQCEGTPNRIFLSGNLIIRDVSSLPALNLFGLHGNLFIQDTGLVDLACLEGLHYIGGNVVIEGNGLLQNLWLPTGAYTGPEFIGPCDAPSDLILEGNAKLNSLSGLSNLRRIGNVLIKYNSDYLGNTGLLDLGGLENLYRVYGDLRIDRNQRMASLQGLSALERIDGDFLIGDVSAPTYYTRNLGESPSPIGHYPWTIGGTLAILGTQMTHLSTFGHLAAIGEGLIIECNKELRDPQLPALDEPGVLSGLTGFFMINNNGKAGANPTANKAWALGYLGLLSQAQKATMILSVQHNDGVTSYSTEDCFTNAGLPCQNIYTAPAGATLRITRVPTSGWSVGISDFSGVDAIVATNVHVYLSDITDTSALNDVAKVYGVLKNFNHHRPVFPALRSVSKYFETTIKSGTPAALGFPSLQAIALDTGLGGGHFSGSYHLDLPNLAMAREELTVHAPALPFDEINLSSLKFVGTLHFGKENYITNPPNSNQTRVDLSSLAFVNYIWLQFIYRSFEISSTSSKLWCIGEPPNTGLSTSFSILDSKQHSSYILPLQNISYLEGDVKFSYNKNYINCQQFSQFWDGTTCVGGSLKNCNGGCAGSYPTCP